MKRRLFILGGCLALMLPAPVFSAPQILNPSFEESGPLVWPGLGPITGWTFFGTVGLNPVPPELTPPALETYVYANNGIIPHGTNVAYLQAGTHRDYDSSLTQNVTGFESGKTYVVRFFHNAAMKNGTYANLIYSVKLGTQTLINNEYLGGVQDYAQFTLPYRRRIAGEFRAPSSGAFDLVFSMESTYHTDLPPGAADGDRQFRGNSAYLLDLVSIVELGSLELQSARRNFTNHQAVTVLFNKEVRGDRATNTANYLISGVRVLKADQVSTNKVLLTTEAIPELPLNLQVVDLVDPEGKGMFAAKSIVPIDISQRMPLDFSQPTRGFEDDFNRGVRDPLWKAVGPAGDIYSERYGFLRVEKTSSSNNFLAYTAPESESDTQNVLLKLRFLEMGSELGGGAVVGLNLGSLEGVSALVRTNKLQLQGKNLPAGPDENVVVNTNGWYWMRLEQRPALNANDPEVFGKIWPADGETEEPAGANWNYAPLSPLRKGFAGIAAGERSSSRFEVDYILIQVPNGPEITPAPPSEYPLSLTIEKIGSELKIQWPTTPGYFLYYSDDLVKWIQLEESPNEDETGFSTYSQLDPAGYRYFQLSNETPSGF